MAVKLQTGLGLEGSRGRVEVGMGMALSRRRHCGRDESATAQAADISAAAILVASQPTLVRALDSGSGNLPSMGAPLTWPKVSSDTDGDRVQWWPAGRGHSAAVVRAEER